MNIPLMQLLDRVTHGTYDLQWLPCPLKCQIGTNYFCISTAVSCRGLLELCSSPAGLHLNYPTRYPEGLIKTQFHISGSVNPNPGQGLVSNYHSSNWIIISTSDSKYCALLAKTNWKKMQRVNHPWRLLFPLAAPWPWAVPWWKGEPWQ